MSIKMPSEEEKNKSMSFILDKGLSQKKNNHIKIPELMGKIGIRNLFWGTWDCIFLALIGGITLATVFILPFVMYKQILPIGLFLFSPAIYGLLHFLTIWKEKQVGLYEIKMTCRYSLKELTAVRMAFFGGASVLSDVLFVLILKRQPDVFLSFFQMIGVSLSALFLYGTATLLSLSYARYSKQWIVPVVWCSVCISPVLFHVDVMEVLMQIPSAVALAVAFLTALLFFVRLEHYVSKSNIGGNYYAVS